MGSTGRQERRPLSPARENGHLHSPPLEGVEPSPKAPGINPGGEYSEVDPLLPNGCLSRTSGCELPGEVKGHHPESQEVTGESVRSMVLQILVPFLLAGLGTVMAGMLLDMVQHWEVFEKVTEIFILVPALLGLKGNLEMTLASRLSTAVNVGKMNSTKEKWNLIIGNLALKQVQATVLGLLAALAASALGWLLDEGLSVGRLALLCCSSVATAFTASLLQGLLMVGVIIGCKRMGINPDNVATPIAASFGDLITLALLALVSQGLFGCMDPAPFVAPLVCIAFLCLVPVWAIISFRHPESRRLLHSGWEPILVAMVISSMGGLILDKTISDPNLMGIVVYTPVINGIGGNLVAIQSSRVATHLHGHCALGQLPSGAQLCRTPCHTFCGKGPNCRSAQVLLVMVVPGQLLFLYLIHVIKGGEMPSNSFICFYMAAVLIQVFLLLCTADCMVHWLWLKGRDPDSFSIPYLTALGDLLGTGLLALSFYLLWVMEGH